MSETKGRVSIPSHIFKTDISFTYAQILMMTRMSHTIIKLCLPAFLFFTPFVPAMEEDGYPIENYRLNKYYGVIGSEDCASGDMAWFVNETGNQALIIMLYTDYHRIQSWHFNPEDMPDIIFNSIALPERKSKNSREWTPLSPEEKTSCLQHFLGIADRIPSRYFITNKGFRLGMPPQKAIDYYGNPTRVETTSEGKLLSWDFAGDPSIPGMKTKEGEAYVENSYGYHLKILFHSEKAAAIIMISNIP